MNHPDPVIIGLLPPSAPAPFDLLLLADPSREIIQRYLANGSVYVAKYESRTVGVYVLVPVSSTTVEIKNIAVDPTFQNRGIGKQLLADATIQAEQQGYSQILIGTGNSSIHQLSLYQQQGFQMKTVKWHFFTEQYQDPIIENGILCQHLIVFGKKIAS